MEQTLVEQVLVDFIYDIAEESFDAEEESSKKKELPPDQLKVVVEALTSGPMDRVLIQKYSVDITRRHLQCLHPLQWLNDEVRNETIRFVRCNLLTGWLLSSTDHQLLVPAAE